MSGTKEKVIYFLKHNAAFNRVVRMVVNVFFCVWGWFVPVDEHTVLFTAHSQDYNDSPRSIYEYMIGEERFRDYRLVWAVKDPERCAIPGDCVKIKADTLGYFALSLKAKYWIACVNIERGFQYKRKTQYYLNTWHGTPLKTIGNAATGRKDYDFSRITFFCSAGAYEDEIYCRDFCLRSESLLHTGLPRNDALYHVTKEQILDMRMRLNIPTDKRVILYAPTWRDSTDTGKTYALKPPIDTIYWEQRISSNYVLLMRTHPYTNRVLGVEFNDFIHDMTAYPSINDLLIVSDILISDYSATFFDYSILERPMIAFCYDYEEYKTERGLYIDLVTAFPGGIARSQDEVINRIVKMDYVQGCNMTRAFKAKYLQYGGSATKTCIEKLFGCKR